MFRHKQSYISLGLLAQIGDNSSAVNSVSRGPLVSASNLNLDFSVQYIDDALPPESPYLYGLHPNAEIGFLTQTSEKLFRTVLEMQPRDTSMGDGGAVTREETVRAVELFHSDTCLIHKECCLAQVCLTAASYNVFCLCWIQTRCLKPPDSKYAEQHHGGMLIGVLSLIGQWLLITP